MTQTDLLFIVTTVQ